MDKGQAVAQFLKEYGQYIPNAPMQLENLTGKMLYDQVKEANVSAGGLDVWRMEEPKKLPQTLWALRAQVCHLSEEKGEWPRSQKWVYQVHPPKTKKGVTPLETRPRREHTQL